METIQETQTIETILIWKNKSKESRKQELINILKADMQEAQSSRNEKKYDALDNLKKSILMESLSYPTAKAIYDSINKN